MLAEDVVPAAAGSVGIFLDSSSGGYHSVSALGSSTGTCTRSFIVGDFQHC